MKSFKVVLPSSNNEASHTTPPPNCDEDEENVEALKKLILSNNPPAQTVQDMLIATRPYRIDWLKNPDISIRDILEKFPALKLPKWVSFNLADCI